MSFGNLSELRELSSLGTRIAVDNALLSAQLCTAEADTEIAKLKQAFVVDQTTGLQDNRATQRISSAAALLHARIAFAREICDDNGWIFQGTKNVPGGATELEWKNAWKENGLEL